MGCIAINALSHTFRTGAGTGEVVYAYPPTPLIAPLMAHLRMCRVRGVLVVPDTPRAQWFGNVMRVAVDTLKVAKAGDSDVLFQHSTGYAASVGPIPFPLIACKFDFE